MLETMDIDKIGMDVPIQEVYPNFVERYFTPRYVLNVHSKGDDICVLFHSNRACLITLAPSHPILALNKKLVKVDFEAEESEIEQVHLKHKNRNERTNRLRNRVRGKKKRGAQVLHKLSLLCKVECEDGSMYSVRSGIPGLLVEINEQLIENPNLLIEKPSSNGYIALMLPKTKESNILRDELMTPEQYKKALEDQVKAEENQEINRESVEVEYDDKVKADHIKVEPNGKVSEEKVALGHDSTMESTNLKH